MKFDNMYISLEWGQHVFEKYFLNVDSFLWEPKHSQMNIFTMHEFCSF